MNAITHEEYYNPLKVNSFLTALSTVQLYRFLNGAGKGYTHGKQLLRPGTSVGARIREAQNAERKSDLIQNKKK